MEVQEYMTSEFAAADAASTLAEAAKEMARMDTGCLPVTEGTQVIGIVTDRDIAIRGVGSDLGANEPVGLIMSRSVISCQTGDDIQAVMEKMAAHQIRRMPVLDDQDNVVGMVSLTDLTKAEPRCGGETLADVGRPSDQHSQELM